MDLTHESITSHQFDLNRRGYDPDAVDAHLREIAAAVAARESEIAGLRRTITELDAKVQDASEWFGIIYGDTTGVVADEDRDFISQAATMLPDDPWGETTWKSWTDDVKQATGRKGKGLFMPLRLALTGKPHGPELAALLPLIGRERAMARLQMDGR